VDLRYDWAVRSDVRPNQPAGLPASDALNYLNETALLGNVSAGQPGSLPFYMAALQYSALHTTSQQAIAGGPLIEQVPTFTHFVRSHFMIEAGIRAWGLRVGASQLLHTTSQ
jgi:hypothetical protein